MYTQSLRSLADIPANQWNTLIQDHNPFLRHEFLYAMERHRCVGQTTGWLPWHILCFDDNDHLVGAAPLYIKDNSYGEFVFDWSWAEAYRHYGLNYYPKLISAIPFTPATGQRLLLSPANNRDAANAIVEHALEDTRRYQFSSLHWLFPSQDNLDILLKKGFLKRLGCQFHWHNRGYRDFDDFLDTLSSKKRKNIKRERQRVREAGLRLQILKGNQASESQWQTCYSFYRSTFQRLGGIPTLNLPFFLEIASTLGEQILLVLAHHGNRLVAGAICLRSDRILYGRHWGCHIDYNSLHFETCYYQGINYCINHGLQTFEPGAQGEHKLYRGFLPTLTQSAHWIADPRFREVIADFLRNETLALYNYTQEQLQHTPYRGEKP
jgi:predicted N-acyltransferase